jgi:hypothetical protein
MLTKGPPMSIQYSTHSLHMGFCDGKHSDRHCNAMIALPRNTQDRFKTIETLGWRLIENDQILCPVCVARNIARAGPTFVIDDEWYKKITQVCYELLRRENSYRDHDLVEIDNRANEMTREFVEICKIKGWTPA